MTLPPPTKAHLNGDVLYGDDFTQEQIEEWFADEADAYVEMTGEGVDSSGYTEWAKRYGYSCLPDRHWGHVLGFGAARGAEVIPLARKSDRITLLESSTQYTPVPEIAERTTFLLAQASGDIDLPSRSVDLLVCFGVLHHIPNVSHVIEEFGRVLVPGGWALIREPIHSMGSRWDVDRPGLTPHERGVPLDLLRSTLTRSGFDIRHQQLLGFPPIGMLWRIWKAPYNIRSLTMLDAACSRILKANLRYNARSRVRKLRPTSVALALTKR